MTVEKAARAGDRVFRVADADLLAGRATDLDGPRRACRAVSLAVRVRIGQPLRIAASVADLTAAAEGPVVETARTRPVTAEDVFEHVAGRLGGSGYVAGDFDLELDPAAGVGFSVLHSASPRGAGAAGPGAARAVVGPPASAARAARPPAASEGGQAPHELAVLADDSRAGAGAARSRGVARLRGRGRAGDDGGKRVGRLLPRIVTDAEEPGVLGSRLDGGAGAVTGNLGTLARSRLARAGRTRRRHGAERHEPLVGRRACPGSVRARSGSRRSCPVGRSRRLSPASPVPAGVVVFGRTELMVAENCVLAAAGACGRRCTSCDRRAAHVGAGRPQGLPLPGAHGREGPVARLQLRHAGSVPRAARDRRRWDRDGRR